MNSKREEKNATRETTLGQMLRSYNEPIFPFLKISHASSKNMNHREKKPLLIFSKPLLKFPKIPSSISEKKIEEKDVKEDEDVKENCSNIPGRRETKT